MELEPVRPRVSPTTIQSFDDFDARLDNRVTETTCADADTEVQLSSGSAGC